MWMFSVEQLESDLQWLKLNQLLTRSFVIPLNLLPTVLRNELKKPVTVFVLPSNCID